MSFITLKNINKSFNGEQVLKDINLTIEEGSTLGILGRSGSGKSVLINMLRGTKEYAPDSGQLFDLAICENKKCLHVEPASKAGEKCPECGAELKAKEIDFWNADRLEKAAIRRRISIMLQRNFALYDEQSVIENVLNAMGDEGRYEEENIYNAIDLLEMVQMSHRVTHIARDLSGGEKQRVVLARQLAKNPMLLLADEPTGTLDPQTAEKLHQTLIEGVKNEGISMVITSHWPEVMNQLADDAIWLDKGEIIEHGHPDVIVPKFLETVPQAEQVEKVEHTEEIIRVKDIKKHYYSIERGVVKAVDGVSLTINQGEIYGIVGLSGSGKTTLTRMMIGLTEPSSGELLYPHRDILGNLTDAISLNLPAEFAKIKAAHILETVGFEKEKSMSILSKWQDELSGGERHRVALAQVLIKEPNIVVLDEPTGTMDPVTRIIVTNSILKARDELDQTFVIISHDMDFVLDVCDKASLMRGGKLLSTGTPEEIVAELTGEEKADMIKDH